jgi:multidrug efflux pump subunit AcrA (membrane-fusion protein)
MRNQLVFNLDECSKFRQTLLARPPGIAHGAVVLLLGLLIAAVLWSVLTRANLVVRGAGRVRPVDSPEKVVIAARPEVLSASTGGRVVAVHFREGDEVHKGALLIRLETEQLDNLIAKQRRTIRSAQEELSNLDNLEKLTARQADSARLKAQAELARAKEDVEQAELVRAAELGKAEAALDSARDEEARSRRLAATNAIAPAERVKAVNRLREARQALAKARAPVTKARVQVAQRALEQSDSDQSVRREELKLKRQVKEGELAAARIDLANRELERKQSEIRAPISGVVTKGDIKVSDVLAPGKPVVEIAKQTGFLFELAVASEDFGDLRLGMPVLIKLDAFDYQRYGALLGTVSFLSPDSGVAEGQTRATHLVRITLEGDRVGRGELQGVVKLGMSGQADIVTGEESLLGLLVKRIRRSISLK